MERNLIVIVVLICIVLLIFAVGYRVTGIFKKSASVPLPAKSESTPEEVRPQKQDIPESDYRSIIQSTQNDYKSFMGKSKSQ